MSPAQGHKERERDQAAKRRKRAEEKDVPIPECVDLATRAELEKDIYEWLYFFGNGDFEYKFTEAQTEIINAILRAIESGGDQAIAAPRGEGKTYLTEWVTMYAVLTGKVRFVVIFSTTGSDAEDCLKSIKTRFEENGILRSYYPEVCEPIAALESTPQRAHSQTVSGKRQDTGATFQKVSSKFSWCGREIVLPNVPGSRSAKTIIATRGLDSAVRGMKRGNVRPELAIIDDPDTEETAASEEQTKKLERKIDRNIAYLGGQKRRIARVLLTTLQNNVCVSAIYTDPEKKPSFRGKRFRFLIEPPERQDLWEEYVILRRNDWIKSTNNAQELYKANLEEMQRGAKLLNPNRKGDEGQIDALECFYYEVARTSMEAVQTELQNDPPQEFGGTDCGLTANRIQKQVSGYPRLMVPPECVKITMGCDIGKYSLHWVVRAWRADGTGFVIDKGVHDVVNTTRNVEEGVDVAIYRAILSHHDQMRQVRYATADKQLRKIDISLYDAGYKTNAVYQACRDIGKGVYPIMGAGKSSGCVKVSFNDELKASRTKKPGDGWFFSKQKSYNVWLVMADADRWKNWEHDRWLTTLGMPGSMQLYGSPATGNEVLSIDERDHVKYAHHIISETEVEEFHNGALRRRWRVRNHNNHWLDASYYSDVGASIVGIRVVSGVDSAPVEVPSSVASMVSSDARKPLTLAEMAAQAR
jgi:hypothetical protein